VADDCLFCAIARRDVPAHRVLETDHVVGFLDVRPVFHGHTLLVPREHVVTLPDLPEELVVPLFGAAQRVATAVKTGLGAHGSFVCVNNEVSQSVAHLHVHVIPRRFKDGLRGFLWPRTKYESEEHAAEVAAAIRVAL
jgi:histidine triad (HIT) family protein